MKIKPYQRRFKESVNSIADEIYNQLGGNKFKVMTGAKNFLAHKNGLQFDLGRNSSGANRIMITLNKMTYDIKFYKITMGRNPNFKIVKEINGIYNDSLVRVFEKETGLYTKL